jgi:hypothetical protein
MNVMRVAAVRDSGKAADSQHQSSKLQAAEHRQTEPRAALLGTDVHGGACRMRGQDTMQPFSFSPMNVVRAAAVRDGGKAADSPHRSSEASSSRTTTG